MTPRSTLRYSYASVVYYTLGAALRTTKWRTARVAVLLLILLLCMGAKLTGCGDVPAGHLGCHRLAVLWEDGGGGWAQSSLMAAIGKAESGGDQFAHLDDTDGSNDEGYWGINSKNEGTYYPTGADRYDPLTNAKAAVTIYNAIGPTAWASYNNGRYHGFCGQ